MIIISNRAHIVHWGSNITCGWIRHKGGKDMSIVQKR